MNKEHFKPRSLKEFKVDSGNLIISDPFYLGYPEVLQDYLDKIRGTVNGKNRLDPSFPFTMFESGALYYNYSYADPGAGEDGLFSVSKKKESILVQDLETPKAIKIKGELFKASLDLCCLLIGDAKIFGQSEQIVSVSPGIYIPQFNVEDRTITIAKK